jgi:hypothetical protein
VGKRSRNRQRRSSSERAGAGDGAGAGDALRAPSSDYSDAQGNLLVLRGSLTPAARAEYAQTLAGLAGPGARAAATQEDAWQRAVELLFERLAISWTIAGAPIERQSELLARFRAASPQERAWVRQTLREHCAEHFPDVHAP